MISYTLGQQGAMSSNQNAETPWAFEFDVDSAGSYFLYLSVNDSGVNDAGEAYPLTARMLYRGLYDEDFQVVEEQVLPAGGMKFTNRAINYLFEAIITRTELQKTFPRFCSRVLLRYARAIVRPREGRLPLVEVPPTNKGGTTKDAHNGYPTSYPIGFLS